MNHSTDTQLLTNLWESLITASSDGVILLEPTGLITAMNPVACSLFGEELLGQSILTFLPSLGVSCSGGLQARAAAGRHERPTLLSPLAGLGTTPIPVQWGNSNLIIQHIGLASAGSLLIIQTPQHRDSSLCSTPYQQKLYDLLMTISSALDAPKILERVLQLTLELIGADAGSIMLYDADHDLVSPGCFVNMPPGTPDVPFHRGKGLIWNVIDTCDPLLLNDYASEPRAMPAFVKAGISAVLGVPIIVGKDYIFGVITLYRVSVDRGFSEHDRDQLVVIGRQLGIAIQNAQLYEKALSEAERRHLLYLASVEMGAALEPDQLYKTIHRAVTRLIACDTFGIALYDAEQQDIAYVYIVDQQGRWPSRRVPLNRGLLGHVIRSGVSLRLSNSDASLEAIFGGEDPEESVSMPHSVLTTVMHTGQQVVGAITMQAFAPTVYTSQDLDDLETLASVAVIAIQNAQLFTHIQRMATIDSLTQIPNRRYFFELAAHELERAERYARPVSLIIFDIDSFKAVNDTYGHIVGDQVLKAVAARCRDDLRDIDTVARFGGEEFIVLLPETTYEHALYVAQRLRLRLRDEPIETDGGSISVTISLGVESYDSTTSSSLKDLVNQADQALYVAKRSGRDRVVGFRSLTNHQHQVNQPEIALKREINQN